MTEFHQAPHGFKYMTRDDGLHVALQTFTYLSPRYRKKVRINEGQVRDGASGALDIPSLGWWVHDQLCADGTWLDGSDVTPWQAATVLSDILKVEGRWFRARTWFWATLFFGCRKAHEGNGDGN